MSATSDFASSKLKPLPNQNNSAPSSGRNTANSSPTEFSSTNPSRHAAYSQMSHNGATANSGRMGAGSPSYESSSNGGSRLFSKRAREIQAEEGVAPPGLWGPMGANPPSSLRDSNHIIQEQQPTTSNGYTENLTATSDYSTPSYRRARAGTVPSKFSPGGIASSPPNLAGLPSTSRPSPAPSPFNQNQNQNQNQNNVPDMNHGSTPVSNPEVKSRLRSGSLGIPPRTNYVGAFGPSIFASSWSQTRERSQTNTGLPTIPTSPAYSSFSKDDESYMASKTLDYLGLVDTPQTSRAQMAKPSALDTLLEGQRAAALQPFMSDLAIQQRNLNRMRSYSVNAKEKYAEDEEEEESRHMYSNQHSGSVTPLQMAGSISVAQATANAHAHALAVAQYASNLTQNRPRARTAGVLESPPVNRMKSYLATPSKLDSMTSASDLGGGYFNDLNTNIDTMKLATMNQRMPDLSSIEESQLEGPTRSLWLGNIPASTTTTSLVHIFQPFGNVESARVLTHKNCGFINYSNAEHAIQARIQLNGKEIFPGAGPTRIGFAKPSSASNGAPTPNGGIYGSPSPDPHHRAHEAPLTREGGSSHGVNGKESNNGPIEVPQLGDLKDDILKIVQEFGAEAPDVEHIARNIEHAISYNDFAPEIPTIPEPSHNRVHDAPKLRDIRKRIDNGNCSQTEIEEIAIAMLPEVAELSSDYLGNTVVQKLFEYCSEEIKETMLVEIGPHLAEIGIHKNGTWAGQKIIDVAKTPAQMSKITDCLRPYTVALFLDQYGNYVLQCCLRFGAPWNDYIFETMLGRMWEISQGRFGSRAMRACLESHHANKNQQRVMAAAIALHSVQLATNANGALLLTWFLDTCNFPRRRTVLAPHLVPHLVHLCTHKVAYLTVLKVINQKNEPEARDTILKALFFSPGDKVLEDILKDHACGATLIFKVLTTPFFEESMRADVVQNVRNVLLKLKATPSQGYKRLMDEVGLSTRNGINNGNTGKDRDGPSHTNGNERRSNQNSNHGTPVQAPRNLDNGGSPYGYGFDPTIASAVAAAQYGQPGIDPNTIRALEHMNLGSLYGTPPPGMASPAVQYALLQQQMGRQNAGFFGLPMNGFPNPPTGPADQFRGQNGGINSPSMAPAMLGGMNAPFNPLVAQQLMGGYAYGMFPPQPQQQQQQQSQQQQQQMPQNQQGGPRRGGRVSERY